MAVVPDQRVWVFVVDRVLPRVVEENIAIRAFERRGLNWHAAMPDTPRVSRESARKLLFSVNRKPMLMAVEPDEFLAFEEFQIR